MAKQLTFTYGGKNYTLEFTRASVRQMESEGFVATEIETKPMTVLPALFRGAFLAHHRFVKQDEIDAIYASLGNKSKLIESLAEMYSEPISALLDEPEEGKNVEWTPNW